MNELQYIRGVDREITMNRKRLLKNYNILFLTNEKNDKSLYERFIADEILPSSRDGQRYMKCIMESEIIEMRISELIEARIQGFINCY